MDKAKPFDIPKREVWEAFKKVKANQGAAGVDGQTVADFEADLSGNLYKLWNRMSSGSYFPPPVRRVMIPKDGRGKAIWRGCQYDVSFLPAASPTALKAVRQTIRAVQFSAIRGILRMKVISSGARQRALRTFLHPAILIVL